MRILDRVARFDEKSWLYPIRTKLPRGATLESKTWSCYADLDQGQEGACVGFGWAHELAARPVKITDVTNEFARKVYKLAQTMDEWSGEAYEGTSVLAGAKAVRQLGFMSEYRWAFGLEDVLQTLSHHGPVVLGLDWYEGMFDTDANGFIRPTGEFMGGHCVMARGIAAVRGYVRIHNSWGPSWGVNGEAKIKFADLQTLLKQDGEACVPMIRLQNVV